MSIQAHQISLLLPSTIDVRGIANMERVDVRLRLDDYLRALSRWLDDPWVHNIVFIENSSYPLDEFVELVKRHSSDKRVEFLSFDGQDFPRSLGKGFGETVSLRYALEHSQQLRETNHFLKVNGRYYVSNIRDVLGCMTPTTGVFCNITKSLSYSDSRVFGGDREFLGYFCREGERISDAAGLWFEHALSKAALHAIADGKSWQFIRRLPVVEGYSGTLNRLYTEPHWKLRIKGAAHSLKQYLLSL